MLEIWALASALNVGLHPSFDRNALPVRIPLLALDEHRRWEQPVDGHVPLAQNDAMIFGDHEASDLVARTQTRERVRNRGRGRVEAAEKRVCVCLEVVRLAFDRYGLDCAGSVAVDAKGDGLKSGRRTGELANQAA